MNRRGTSALFLPLAAILALAFPFAFTVRQGSAPSEQESAKPRRPSANNQEKASSGEKKNGKSKPEAPKAHDAKKILEEFVGSELTDQINLEEDDPRSKYTLDFMIVTVPDPIASRLPYLFDRFLASIQRAAEANNFVLDRFDLPWLEELQKSEAAKGNTENSGGPLAETAAFHPFDKQPGLVLFRDPLSGPHPRLLLLFLVGETPTAGIHKEAFLAALKQIGGICRSQHVFSAQKKNSATSEDPLSQTPSPQLDPYDSCSPIKILGPTFSGSAESLDFALHSWMASRQNPDRISFKIVSGSATAIPIGCEPRVDCRRYFVLGKNGNQATFSSTVIPDEIALHQFLRYAWSQHMLAAPFRVGLLTEANTAYGVSLTTNVKGTGAVRTCGPPSPSNLKPGGQAVIYTLEACVVSLPFPLHISRLRSESEKARKSREQSSQQMNPNADSSRFLPVPFEDESEGASDAIPPFSQLDTSSSEVILANLLSTISHERFDYVGIAATDVRDAIFLAREIREHSPSTVMFSLNADLLYAHPEANPNTRGMLVVTPYPLFTLNQRWMDPSQTVPVRLQFPDQNSQGVYNAMLVLLRQQGSMLEYGIPFMYPSDIAPLDSSNQSSGGLPEQLRRPPLWITTVGRGGFWPVAVLRSPNSNGYTFPLDSPPPDLIGGGADLNLGMTPHAVIFVFILWSLFCCIPSWIFLRRHFSRRYSGSSKRDLDFGALSVFRESAFASNRGECRAYFLVGGVAALGAYVVAAAAYAITALHFWEFSLGPVILIAMSIVIAMAITACFSLGCDVFTLAHAPKEKVHRQVEDHPVAPANGSLAVPVLLSSVISLGLATCLAGRWIYLRFHLNADQPFAANGIVTGFRAVNLLSGVSPLPPLFLIAIATACWAACSVRRIRLAEALPPISGSESDLPEASPALKDKQSLFNSIRPSFSGFAVLESRVQALLRCPAFHLPDSFRMVSFAVVVTIIGAGIYLFYHRLVVAFESPIFYMLFGVCFILVYISIVLNILRLFFLWRALRNVLQLLERHPIRAAFARFHRAHPGMPRINLAAAPSPLTSLEFSVDQARGLFQSAKALIPAPVARADIGLATSIAKAESPIQLAERLYRIAVRAGALGHWRLSLLCQIKSQRCLAQVSCFIEDALELSWMTSAAPGAAESSERDHKGIVKQGEEFLVGRTVHFLSHVFPQLTNLAFYSFASLFFMLVAVSSYPFQPHNLLLLFNWTVILAFAGVALLMSVQMNRDPVLSRLNGTRPGELSWDREFISRIIFYVALPILAILGVQFPDAFSQIFTLLSPGAAGHP